MGFTSKLQGRKILTCCKFLQFKLNLYLLQFLKYNTKSIKIKKKIDRREPSNDYFIKILFLLSKWFQTRRFLWEFPIGSYVKLCSAVAAILVGGLKYQTQIFFKFHPPVFYFQLGGYLGRKSGSPDTFLEGGHPRIISPKFGCNWPSGF